MISIQTVGRFGNQLFEYATCRSIAEKHGYNFYIDFYPGFEQIKRFNIPFGEKDKNTKYILNSDYCIDYFRKNQVLPKEYHDIKNNTKLIGFFQHQEFFNFNKTNIQNWFSVDKLINLQIFNNLYNKYKDYCFIHVRGGDFKQIQGCYLPIEYYIKAMADIINIKKDIKFVIVTDDVIFAREMFCDLDIISSSDYLIDFKLLQIAQYLICSNSTFCWWGAYLNKTIKKVIHPIEDHLTYLWK